MKKVVFILLCLGATLACRKEETGEPTENISAFEQRIQGDWDLQAVKYDGEIPNPLSPGSTIEIKGNGTSVVGGHTVTRKPNRIDYNYSFTAQVNFNGVPIPVPVQQQGLGEWTLNESEDRIFITEEGETVVWTVLINEANKQVYAAQLTQQIQGIAVLIDTELTFVR
jgi:hypothetical protein